MFGPEPGKGGSYIRVHNSMPGDLQPGQVWIDHICFTLSNWEEGRVRAAMKAKGPEISGGHPGSLARARPIQLRYPVRQNCRRKRLQMLKGKGSTMEGFVAQKLNEFERGKISRRRRIETLTLAATTAYAADGAKAQANTTLKAQLISHTATVRTTGSPRTGTRTGTRRCLSSTRSAKAATMSQCRSARTARSPTMSLPKTCLYHISSCARATGIFDRRPVRALLPRAACSRHLVHSRGFQPRAGARSLAHWGSGMCATPGRAASGRRTPPATPSRSMALKAMR